MAKNRLSVIIPVCNERERIIKLVDFLLSTQSDNLVEIVIVNSGKSTDNLEELKFPEKVKLISTDFSCRSLQLQKGAEDSNGDILYFLHADTFPPNDYISHILKTLDDYDFGMFNYRFDKDQWNFKFNGWMTQWKAFYTGGGDQGLFLSKDIFEKVGGFNTTLSIMEDYDIFWRLKKLKLKYDIVKSPAIVSARKYEKNNGFKVNIVNLITLIGFRITGNGDKWCKFYRRFIK